LKTAVLRDARNYLIISICSGTAKNLRDPWFGEKPENFGKIGQYGEWAREEILSIYIGKTVGKTSGTVIFQR
jgi:hypothetical protein